VFLIGPLPVAEGLYRAGLWPRLTPDEVREKFWTRYHIDLTRCSKGVNGWDYLCEPPADPNRHYDKVGVMGSVFGIGSWSEFPPGPVPDRSAFEARDGPGSNACGAASADVGRGAGSTRDSAIEDAPAPARPLARSPAVVRPRRAAVVHKGGAPRRSGCKVSVADAADTPSDGPARWRWSFWQRQGLLG
jgi:hypothetical protein